LFDVMAGCGDNGTSAWRATPRREGGEHTAAG
jgi:hypothetical protein